MGGLLEEMGSSNINLALGARTIDFMERRHRILTAHASQHVSAELSQFLILTCFVSTDIHVIYKRSSTPEFYGVLFRAYTGSRNQLKM